VLDKSNSILGEQIAQVNKDFAVGIKAVSDKQEEQPTKSENKSNLNV